MHNDELNDLIVVIPAAGVGSRMKNKIPKQYINVDGKTILLHTVEALSHHPKLLKFIIVVSKEDEWIYHINFPPHLQIDIIFGGDERADSVYEGVRHAINKYQSKWVLVHDAARPLVHSSEVDKLLDSISSKPFDASQSVGAILAIPIKDTIKKITQIDKSFYTKETFPREKLMAAQTPQLFPTKILNEALSYCKRNNLIVTDEASAVEQYGAKTFLVEGSSTNIKITEPNDLEFMKFVLSKNTRTG